MIVTIISIHPTVSQSESDQLSTFLSTYPNIRRLNFQLMTSQEKRSNLKNDDPFFRQMEAIDNSVHHLIPLLSSLSPSVSAIIADFPITRSVTDIASKLSIDAYVFVTTSSRFLSLMTCLPELAKSGYLESNADVEIPGLGRMSVSSIPPLMLDSNTFFSASICSSVSSFFKAKGVLINTFQWFESEAIEALKRRCEVPIYPIGPLESFGTNNKMDTSWLDNQEPASVIFVSFGSRAALSKDQITELGLGLEQSGCKFLWIIKTSIVDKDDKEEVEQILGQPFLARTKNHGTIVKGWVNQEQILAHPSIGGFISHCGWNSVIEAAKFGVPILAWPQHGDARVNAEVVQNVGFGLWVKEWGWARQKLVHKDEIARMVKEVMCGGNLRDRAMEVKTKAREARQSNGTSESLLQGLIESLITNNVEQDS